VTEGTASPDGRTLERSIGTAFVTGGSGFVGGALVRRLVSDGVRVRALARSEEAAVTVRALGAEPVPGSILDEASMRPSMRGCDVVFHTAGVNAACVRDPGPMYAANVSGVERVIRAAAAANVPRVVHTSSAAAVAEPAGTIGREDTEPSGSFLTHYARSKYLGERRAFATSVETGVEVVAVSPSSVQGPGRTTGTARLLVAAARAPVVVLVRTWLSIVDVGDCATAHVLAARRALPGTRYLVSAPSVTVEDAVEILRSITGRPRRVVWVPRGVVRAIAPLSTAAARFGTRDPIVCAAMIRTLLHGHRYDASRSVTELGVDYRPLADTLRRTLDWHATSGLPRRTPPA
jgi:dihydroflavonol-4-reductase